ncbi:MAG: hypothetical protein IPO83_11410 [Chitinophagaceae bacterium]|nr:hypothetical protein [Chitinophagaceae bacterium]
MKNLRHHLTALFLVVFICAANAQNAEMMGSPKVPFKDRIFVGGNFGLTFGTITNIEIAPTFGYMLKPNWSAGVGVRYSYYQDNFYNPPYKTNIYGGLLFTRYVVYKGLFLEANFEGNNFDVYKFDPVTELYYPERDWIPSLLLGGGYSQPMGANSAFFISILYDVLQNNYSPYYGVPIIRAGFGIGL